MPTSIIKPHGARPWSEGNAATNNDTNSDIIKGDRARGAFLKARESNSRDWERLRVNVKSRPKAEPLIFGSAVPSASVSGATRNTTEQRGRIKLRGSFLGLYSKGVTPRPVRPDEDLPQRPDKRERIRNLRIRLPFNSDSKRPAATTTTSPVTASTTTSSSTFGAINEPSSTTTTTTVPTSTSTETVINLKAIVREYKELVRTSSTYAPVSSSTQYNKHVKTDELLTLNDDDDATTISTSPTTGSSVTTTITTTAQNPTVTGDNSTLSPTHLTKNAETLPNSDSSENVINSTSQSVSAVSSKSGASSSKSLKPSSIQSAVPSTSASLTVTESKVLPGSSQIKQSKTHNDQTLSPQSDITTRNPIEILRPREELQKDLIEAIKRKISRTKATQISVNQADNEGRSFSSASTIRPSLFRPLLAVNSKKNSSKPADSRVNIFNNLPSKYQASASVKIPNIAKLEDNLEQINEAIEETEFELDTLKNVADAAEYDKNLKSVVKSHSSSVQIVSHSNDAGNQETIRKQLFNARSKTGTDIKYQFDSTTTPTTSTTTAATTMLTSTTKPKIVRTEPTTVSSGPSKKKAASEHPSSHFRPTSNWTNGDFIPMPKSNLPPKGDVRLFVVTPKFVTNTPIIEKNNSNQGGNSTAPDVVNQEPSSSSSSSSETDDITNTAIYVIAVIAVIPVAGLVAWGTRSLLRRKVRY